MKKLLLLITLMISVVIVNAQSFAIIAADGDAPDHVTMVALEEIPANTTIFVTDNNYDSGSDSFTTGEGTLQVVLTALVPKGTVFTVTDGSPWTLSGATGTVTEPDTDFNISTSGDAVYVYAGTIGSPTAIYAVSDNRSGTISATINPISNYPDVNVLDFTIHRDNFSFIGDRTTAQLSDLLNPSSYNYDNGSIAVDNTNFSGTSLPVEFTNISVRTKNSKNQITWQTASEINNEKFEIQRSRNGKTFSPIGNVAGAGESYTLLDYSYTDERPIAGVNYYRIMNVDYDGKYAFSEIVSVIVELKGVQIRPSSTYDYVTVSTSDRAKITVFNMSGAIMTQLDSEGTIQVNMVSYPQGMYLVSVSINGTTETKKVIRM